MCTKDEPGLIDSALTSEVWRSPFLSRKEKFCILSFYAALEFLLFREYTTLLLQPPRDCRPL